MKLLQTPIANAHASGEPVNVNLAEWTVIGQLLLEDAYEVAERVDLGWSSRPRPHDLHQIGEVAHLLDERDQRGLVAEILRRLGRWLLLDVHDGIGMNASMQRNLSAHADEPHAACTKL